MANTYKPKFNGFSVINFIYTWEYIICAQNTKSKYLDWLISEFE